MERCIQLVSLAENAQNACWRTLPLGSGRLGGGYTCSCALNKGGTNFSIRCGQDILMKCHSFGCLGMTDVRRFDYGKVEIQKLSS